MWIIAGIIGFIIWLIANKTTSYQKELIKIYKAHNAGLIDVDEMCKRSHELNLKYNKYGR